MNLDERVNQHIGNSFENDRNIDDIFIDAARDGDYNTVDTLLNNNRLNIFTAGIIAMILASRNRHIDIVSLLLIDGRTDPSKYISNHQNNNTIGYNSPIGQAIKNDDLAIFKILYDDDRVFYRPNSKKNRGLEYMQMAAGVGSIKILSYLLYDPNININIDDDSDLIGPLAAACQNNKYNVVKLLLSEKKIDPNYPDGLPIILASRNGYYGIVELLMSHPKTDPCIDNNQALKEAYENGYHEVLDLIATKCKNKTRQRHSIINFITNIYRQQ